MENSSDYWSDYWKHDGAEGEVFVNSIGERPDYITEYWANVFRESAASHRVIDIASGAGSIYDGLSNKKQMSLSLHATDLSEAALKILEKRINSASVYVCSSLELPFDDRSFDLVVSQFGLEYSGVEAFNEAARLVGPSGHLAILSHYRDGYIDQRNKSFLAGAKLALSSGYIETAIDLTKAIFTGSKAQVRKAEPPFIAAQLVLAKSFDIHPEGIHRHLYFGYREMYMKVQNYHAQDIIDWLQAMKKDIKKNIQKVTKIREVSLTEDDVRGIESILLRHGLSSIRIDPLKIPDTERIVAWSITANKVES